jgi:hypothetical protein
VQRIDVMAGGQRQRRLFRNGRFAIGNAGIGDDDDIRRAGLVA